MILFLFFFLVPFILFILLYLLRLSKNISKLIAVFIDFLLIGGIVAYSVHGKLSVKIASGNAVYFWDIVFGIGACFIYYILLNYLVINFPKLAAVINYVIAWVGTLIIYGMTLILFYGGFPQLLNNYDLSMIIHIIIITMLAFVTFNIRKNIFVAQYELSR